MDLQAYTQIQDLEALASVNGISVPRLRGYRLMKEEEKVTDEEMAEIIHRQSVQEAEYLCRSNWGKSIGHEYSMRTDALCSQYLTYEMEERMFCGKPYMSKTYTGIRWDRIHGKRRKLLKWRIRQTKKNVLNQFRMWNQYVGREDVLYIHSRTGGRSWTSTEQRDGMRSQPWFLGKVDDYFDPSYCDIYAKLTVFPEIIGECGEQKEEKQ